METEEKVKNVQDIIQTSKVDPKTSSLPFKMRALSSLQVVFLRAALLLERDLALLFLKWKEVKGDRETDTEPSKVEILTKLWKGMEDKSKTNPRATAARDYKPEGDAYKDTR